eukprot:403362634
MESNSQQKSQDTQIVQPIQEFDKSRRPKVGCGLMILNEFDEVLCGQRIKPGPFLNKWQFPGGYMEFGETFQQAVARETYEESGVQLDPERIHYICTTNVMDLDIGYHNVGISMFTLVKKDEYNFINTEPTKQTDWRWVKWSEFVEYENLFNPFQYFFQQGFKDLNKVKQAAGLTQ